MDRGRKMLRKLIFPHPALVVLTAAAAAIALTWAFSDGAEGSPGVYGAYTLSAYGLTLVCVRVPALVRGVRRLVREEPHIRRCMDDAGLRTGLTLIPSVAANGGYALLQLGLGILNRSVWYYALSAYYGLLLLMRCTLLLRMGRSGLGQDLRSEYRLFLGCGGVLTVMNAALAVIVSYMVWQNRGFTHHPITTNRHGGLYLLHPDHGCHQRGALPPLQQPGAVGVQDGGAGSGAGVHAVPGDGHAQCLRQRGRQSLPAGHAGCQRRRGVSGRSGHGAVYDGSGGKRAGPAEKRSTGL